MKENLRPTFEDCVKHVRRICHAAEVVHNAAPWTEDQKIDFAKEIYTLYQIIDGDEEKYKMFMKAAQEHDKAKTKDISLEKEFRFRMMYSNFNPED